MEDDNFFEEDFYFENEEQKKNQPVLPSYDPKNPKNPPLLTVPSVPKPKEKPIEKGDNEQTNEKNSEDSFEIISKDEFKFMPVSKSQETLKAKYEEKRSKEEFVVVEGKEDVVKKIDEEKKDEFVVVGKDDVKFMPNSKDIEEESQNETFKKAKRKSIGSRLKGFRKGLGKISGKLSKFGSKTYKNVKKNVKKNIQKIEDNIENEIIKFGEISDPPFTLTAPSSRVYSPRMGKLTRKLFNSFEIDFICLCEFHLEVGAKMVIHFPLDYKFEGELKEKIVGNCIPDGSHLIDTIDYNTFLVSEKTNALNCIINQKSERFVRNYRILSLCVCSKNQFLYSLKPVLAHQLNEIYGKTNDEKAMVYQLSKLFAFLNKMKEDCVCEIPYRHEKNILMYGVRDTNKLAMAEREKYVKSVNLSFPSYTANISMNFMTTSSWKDFSIQKLYRYFGPENMSRLFNSLLFGKKVLLLTKSIRGGHKKDNQMVSAGELSFIVRSCELLFPNIPTVGEYFLSNVSVDFEETFEGVKWCLIASTNPLFETKIQLWDVCFFLEPGRFAFTILLSKQPHNRFAECKENSEIVLESEEVFKIKSTNDKFFQDVLAKYLYSLKTNDVKYDQIEYSLGSKIRQYCQLMYRKLEEIKFTEKLMIPLLEFNALPTTYFDDKNKMDFYVIKIKYHKEMEDNDLIQILQYFRKEIDETKKMNEFLEYWKADGSIVTDKDMGSVGGLYDLAILTMHNCQAVALLACWILKMVENCPFGRIMFKDLNMFLLISFARNCGKFEIDNLMSK